MCELDRTIFFVCKSTNKVNVLRELNALLLSSHGLQTWAFSSSFPALIYISWGFRGSSILFLNWIVCAFDFLLYPFIRKQGDFVVTLLLSHFVHLSTCLSDKSLKTTMMSVFLFLPKDLKIEIAINFVPPKWAKPDLAWMHTVLPYLKRFIRQVHMWCSQ